jgi:hypothetical protein
MARTRATLLLRPAPADYYPPCDMRRYVELAVGRSRKDMSKARRVNPSMGVGPIMRNYIIDDYHSFSSFDVQLRQGSSFPVDHVYVNGPTSIHDASLFLWRQYIYRNLKHSYIPIETPLFDTKGQEFIDWMSKGFYIAGSRYLDNTNHALEFVRYDGNFYKRKADFLIQHYFAPREYLANAKLLVLTGWNMSEYRPPAPDPAPDDEATMREAEYDDDYEDDED